METEPSLAAALPCEQSPLAANGLEAASVIKSPEANQAQQQPTVADGKESAEQEKEAQERKVDNDDEDEDVREAKASIKGHLDRMRATDEFIKSMQAQEESQERQRQQQLFLFNNLLLSTKLNGLPLSSIGSTGGRGGGSQSFSSSTSIGGKFPFVNTNCPQISPFSMCETGQLASTTTTIDNCSGAKVTAYSAPIVHVNPLQQQQQQPSQPDAPLSCFSSDLFRPQKLTAEPTSATSYANPFKPLVEPLELVQPVWLSSSGGPSSARSPTRWRRSKSQLGDQFAAGCSTALDSFGGWRAPETGAYAQGNKLGRRPVSAAIGHQTSLDAYCRWPTSSNSPVGAPSSLDAQLRPVAPRGRRSLSQVTRHHHFRPTTNGWPAGAANSQLLDEPAARTSEYRSSFGAPSSKLGLSSLGPGPTRRARSPLRRPLSPLAKPMQLSSNGQSDDDDGCEAAALRSSYSARSYVPAARLSSPVARRRRSDIVSSLADQGKISSLAYTRRGDEQRPRRSSVTAAQTCSNSSDEEAEGGGGARSRRYSERALSSGRVASAENSRLSELEQRLQANKKRREQLLAGKLTDSPPPHSPVRVQAEPLVGAKQRDDDDGDEHVDEQLAKSFGFERPSSWTAGGCRSRGVQLVEKGPNAPDTGEELGVCAGEQNSQSNAPLARRNRPSRLESMEARIKRRSYCVRVSSPDRNSLAARQATSRLAATSGSNSRDIE